MEGAEAPYRLSLRVVALRDLPDVTPDLGVAAQIVKELRVGGAEKPFANRTKPGFGGRPRFLGALIFGQECFEIRALELGTAVDNDNLWKTIVPRDTIPQNHHAGSVTRLIECQVKRETPSGKRIGEDRHPWSAKGSASLGTNNFHVQLSMVDMADLKRTIAMTRRRQLEFVIEGRVDVSGAPALSLESLLERRTAPHRSIERNVTRSSNTAFVALPLQRRP